MAEVTRAWGVEAAGCLRAVVIGAGSMGAGIAAQFANAGVAVDLLDIPAEGARNARAEAGIAAQIKAGGFAGAAPVALVRAGNVEDDLARVAGADWIIEAVIEKLDVKRALFAQLAPHVAPHAVLASNTSTIPRAQLIEGMDPDLAARFVIAHFFNPPRHMALLELVSASDKAAALVRGAGRKALGKTVIDCRDTPGFIANRIGCTWMSIGIVEALRLGLTLEEADAVQGAFGVPRTGVFGLMDLVGIDLIPTVWGSLMRALPATDAINRYDLPGTGLVGQMLAAGRFGRKSGAGFYRKGPSGAREVIDPASGEYRAVSEPVLPGKGRDLEALLLDEGKLGAYARAVLGAVLRYATAHVNEISTGPAALDTAMMLGYAWRKGPFAIAMGLSPAARKMLELPPMPSVQRDSSMHDPLDRAKEAGAKIAGNASASLWDLGDGVGCLELTTKMNAVDTGVLEMVEESVARMGGAISALVVGNHDPRAFSAGANLANFIAMIEAQDWAAIDAFIARGQRAYTALARAEAPSVAAVRGLALGGGCELALHCHARAVHLEAKIGLPEHSLGLLPGWGGTTRMLMQTGAPEVALGLLTRAAPAPSGREAMALGMLPAGDTIVMHEGDVIGAAFEMARALRARTSPSTDAPCFPARMPEAASALVHSLASRVGGLSPADAAVVAEIAGVLTGASSEDEMMDLERAAFLRMAQVPLTLSRIRHILETGKPLKT